MRSPVHAAPHTNVCARDTHAHTHHHHDDDARMIVDAALLAHSMSLACVIGRTIASLGYVSVAYVVYMVYEFIDVSPFPALAAALHAQGRSRLHCMHKVFSASLACPLFPTQISPTAP